MKHALLFVGLLVAAPASAAPTATPTTTAAQFSIGPATLIMPVIAGYCPPEGDLATGLAMVNAADPVNDTPVSLVACRPGVPPMSEYYLIKSVKDFKAAELSRPVLLAGLGPAFKQLDTKALFEKAKEAMKDGLGGSITIGEGSISPSGQDDVCGYLLGTMTVQSAGGASKLVAAICITTVKHKIISINRYESADAKRTPLALLADVRAIAERMIATNEH